MTLYVRGSVTCSLLALSACSDTPSVHLPATTTMSPSEVVLPDARVAECDQAPNGTPCGKPGGETHCISFDCIRNACGDGVKAGEEECDDGDEIDHDGCDSHCRIDFPSCGNGVLDPYEECDDGAKNGGDCTARCTKRRCGDGVLSPGEECDEGRDIDTGTCLKNCRKPVSTDAGADSGSGAGTQDAGSATGSDAGGDAALDAASDAGMDASKEAGPGSGTEAGPEAGHEAGPAPTTCAAGSVGEQCAKCRKDHCLAYNDDPTIDLPHGCFRSPNGGLGADSRDPLFIQQCLDVVNCAQQYGCGKDAVAKGAGCYCGQHDPAKPPDLDICNSSGPATNGSAKCVAQWQAAARSTSNADIQGRFSDFAFPSAWAFFMLECDATSCLTTCTAPEASCANYADYPAPPQ